MKKVFAIALAVVMMLSVVLGCGGKKDAQPAPSQTKITESQNKDKNYAASEKTKQKDDKQQKQTSKTNDPADSTAATGAKVKVEKGKAYTDKDHVAAYIHVYKTLPPNYITKGQAAKLG